jgi:hypothetical protein
MFTDSASFILRATVAGKNPGKGSISKRTANKAGGPLWDPKQLHKKDTFSCISYLKVKNIEDLKITVENHLGGCWFISKDLLEREMWSADHYSKEITCTMTNLSEILCKCKDTIFTV